MGRITARIGRTLAGILAAALMISGTSAAAEEIRLAPSADGNWVLNYGDDRCRLARYFGEGEQRSLLLLEQFAPGMSVALTAAGPPLRRIVRGNQVRVRFGPSTREAPPFDPPEAEFEGVGPALFIPGIAPVVDPDASAAFLQNAEVNGLPQIDPAAAAAIEWLGISGRNLDLVFEFGSLENAVTVLNHCTLDLVKFWGLDPQQHLTMTRMAAAENMEQVAREVQEAYPMRAVARGEQATLVMRAVVRADGTVGDCAISQATVTETFQSPACDVFRRYARFAPALDADGQPMASFYATTIVYTIH
jgi:TonB family protein